MLFSDKKTVNTLVALCEQAGLREVVVSPGSRNAPLMFSFGASRKIQTTTVVDERSAAFFALGMAQQLGRPVALVCTSGTAALNYAPAISEAYYQHIPLVVITADRPAEWIDQADGQTIRQHDIYHNYIGYSCTLPAEIDHLSDERMIVRNLSQAFDICTNNLLPVHINVPLNEPLYGRQSNSVETRLIASLHTQPTLSENHIQYLSEKWNAAERIMILVGTQNPNYDCFVETRLIASLQSSNTILLTETTSNLTNDTFINCIDRTLATIPDGEKAAFAPDLLITFGGQVVSKNIKTMLRNNPPKEHWHISPQGDAPDTYQCLTQALHCNPNDLFAAWASISTPLNDHSTPLNDHLPRHHSDYQQRWLQKKEIARSRHNAFLQKSVWSDWRVFSILTKNIPAGSLVQLANSTPIRYAQLFDSYNSGLSFFANRGTSGIDGCTSTAAGAAFAADKPTLLITGDLSFLYDSNALWNKHLKPNFKIIVINNGGGGIFRYVSGKMEEDEMQQYFEASHDFSCSHLAACFGLDYHCAGNETELNEKLPLFLTQNTKPQLLEIRTIGVENAEVLKDYFKEISR